MKYCKRCVQPDTRPGIYFNDENVCGACLWEDEKKNINWEEREQEAREIAQWAKDQKASYDCVIGVSGGKDSTLQALYARDTLGLRPLLVCSEPYSNAPEGFANQENIKSLGFDVLSMRPNPHAFMKFYRKDFFEILNPNRASEYPLHSSVYIIADKFDIPLVINGENPGQTLGLAELKKVGGDATSIFKHNTVKQSVTEMYKDLADAEELFMYRADMKKIAQKGIRGVWLSNYIKDWGQIHNARFSLKHGLTIRGWDMDPYATGYYRRFHALDHTTRTVNQHLKYIKFGFGFCTDQACYDIRDKEITREEAIFLVRELDSACGKKELVDFCALIGISEGEFWEHANTFRGDMWENVNGTWKLKNPIWEQEPIKGEYSVKAIMQRLGI